MLEPRNERSRLSLRWSRDRLVRFVALEASLDDLARPSSHAAGGMGDPPLLRDQPHHYRRLGGAFPRWCSRVDSYAVVGAPGIRRDSIGPWSSVPQFRLLVFLSPAPRHGFAELPIAPSGGRRTRCPTRRCS